MNTRSLKLPYTGTGQDDVVINSNEKCFKC